MGVTIDRIKDHRHLFFLVYGVMRQYVHGAVRCHRSLLRVALLDVLLDTFIIFTQSLVSLERSFAGFYSSECVANALILLSIIIDNIIDHSILLSKLQQHGVDTS